MANQFRIGDLIVDQSSGEVFRREDERLTLIGRLAPQPAELLALMLANHPGITTHEVIRETLWPGLQADFEKNMHFCVGKLRSALGDSASQPKYIQTIPRRGYRFVDHVQIEVLELLSGQLGDHSELGTSASWKSIVMAPDEETDRQPAVSSGMPMERSARAGSKWTARHRWGTLVFAVVIVILIGFVQYSQPGRSEKRPLRVGVMTFEPAEAVSDASLRNDIAEQLVERLANSDRLAVQVIGPTTTIAFDGYQARLDDLIQEYDLDYLINGRFFADRPRQFLAEVIRAEDRAHIWVRQMDRTADLVAAADRVETGFLASLEK